jgi:molybdate transport system permease protein
LTALPVPALTPDETEIVLLSLRVSLWAVGCALPLAIAIALLLARCEFPGKALLDGLVHLPLVLPPVVIGYLLLLLFGRQGVFGSVLDRWFGVTVAFRWTGAAIAAGVMAFPLMVRAIRLSIEAIDTRLQAAAATLGAGAVSIFATVSLPLMLPGIVAGTVLGFGKSLGEFGATITFVSNIPGETRTLPLAIYALTQVPSGDAPALRLVAVSVVLSLGALVVSEFLARRARRRVHGA